MHHKPADAARCRMQSTQTDLGVALLSMLGPLTLPVATVEYRAGNLRTASQRLRRQTTFGLDRSSRRSSASQLIFRPISITRSSGATAPAVSTSRLLAGIGASS